jgi:hypothetical protein
MSTAVSSAVRGTTSPSDAADMRSPNGRMPSGTGAWPKPTRYSGTPSTSQALPASAWKPSNPISAAAEESPRWYSISGAMSRGLSGSTTIPAFRAPK